MTTKSSSDPFHQGSKLTAKHLNTQWQIQDLQ